MSVKTPVKKPRGRPRKHAAGTVGEIGGLKNVPLGVIAFCERVGGGSVQAGAKILLERAAALGQ